MLLIENAILAALEAEAAEAVLHGWEAGVAVENIGDPLPAVIREECAIDIVATPVAFVEKFAAQSPHGEIAAEAGAIQKFIAVRALLKIFGIEDEAAVLALLNVVADGILTLHNVQGTLRNFQAGFLALLAHMRDDCVVQFQISYFLHPLFPGNRLIEDVIFLLHEPVTAEAIPAATYIRAEETFGAVIAILAVETSMRVTYVNAFITELAVIDAQGVAAVFAVIDSAGVVAILVLLGLCDEITVPRFAAAVRVLRILIHRGIDEQAEVRHAVTELFELLEERAGEIKCPTVRSRIPTIGEPITDVVDRKGSIDGMHRKHFAPGEIACSFVQCSLVPPCKPSQIAACGTECG
jgi:hypothetical protein